MEAKTISRHVTFDLYTCKPVETDIVSHLREELPTLLENAGFHVLLTDSRSIDESHLAAVILMNEGHFTVHLYPELKYAACDFYLCAPGAKPEQIFKELKSVLRPEKTKTTYLKRGDFGTVTDMKPKIKTRFAPLRKIKNTGAKMISCLKTNKK